MDQTLFLQNHFYCGIIYTTKLTIFTILSIQSSGITCIHIVVQLLPLSISRTFLSPHIRVLYPANNDSLLFPSFSL